MSPRNKNFAAHTEVLNNLWKDVREMEFEIKIEEAAFGDFKRTATKVWMGLKFGGLAECCEKGMVRIFFLSSFCSSINSLHLSTY